MMETGDETTCEAVIFFYKKNGEEFRRKLRGRPTSFQGRTACLLELDLQENLANAQTDASSSSSEQTADTKHDDAARLMISAAPPHHILSATPSFLRASGFGQHQLIGASIRVLSGPDTDHAVLRALPLPAATAPPRDLILYRRDGEPIRGTARRVPAAAAAEDCAIAFDAAADSPDASLPSPPPAAPPPAPPARSAPPRRPAGGGWNAGAGASSGPPAGVEDWVLLHMRTVRLAARAEAARRASERVEGA
jgi:hypothetical protein